jgi:hypothetical protein
VSILILLPNYSIGENKSGSTFWKNDTLHSDNNVYIYFRYDKDETVMVLMNNSNETKTLKPTFQKNIKTLKPEKM